MTKSLWYVALGLVAVLAGLAQASAGRVSAQGSPPSIGALSDNRSQYANGQIPKFEKLEITFQLSTSAQNLQWPYDPAPPPGVTPGAGVTVYAVFTSPSNQTYSQPAFYFQEYDDQIKSGREWFYPTGQFSWKARFAPDQAGTWQYKVTAQDANGSIQSTSQSFTVVSSANRGFIRVGKNDPRYFEFQDGTYFPGLGYNMNYNHVDWTNPVLSNQANFQLMKQNGIQLTRIWLSQWAIFGSAWNPWYGIRNDYDGYLPRTGLLANTLNSETSPSYKLTLVYSEDPVTGAKNSGNWFDACRLIGGYDPPSAVKQNTIYHIKIKYWGFDMTGPRNSGYAGYGLAAKVQNPNDGNWHTQCYEPADPTNGVVVTPFGHDAPGGAYLEGQWNSGTRDFLPIFYLTLDNVNAINSQTGRQPYVFVQSVAIQEDLGNGQYGPNIVTKPSMEQEVYFEQRNSYAFDKVVELAHQNDIYLKPVILEKNELIQNEIGYNGLPSGTFDNNHFYGDWRNPTAVRWLQMTWWRYLQARWGYSPNIHSWELVNEADPSNGNHYAQTDEFGKYEHCTVFGIAVASGDAQKCVYNHPNSHLITTSFWSGFPKALFWGNSNYPNVDFADVHQYIDKATDPTHFNDTAQSTFDVSMWLGAKQSGGVGKPVLRGETGLTDSGTQPPTNDVLRDANGIWLHNFIWGGINAGGLIESYWYEIPHIYGSTYDHRSEYGTFYQFIKNIPLNNGNYIDAGAASTNGSIRVWGQKDPVNGQAHLWVQNVNHTWQNVVNGVSIPPLAGNISIAGLSPQKMYTVQWWNPYSGMVTNTQAIPSDAQGTLVLAVSNLNCDMAVKIFSSPSPPTVPPVSRVWLPLINRSLQSSVTGCS